MHFVRVYTPTINKIILLWRQSCWDLVLAYSIELTVPKLLVLSEASGIFRISDIDCKNDHCLLLAIYLTMLNALYEQCIVQLSYSVTHTAIYDNLLLFCIYLHDNCWPLYYVVISLFLSSSRIKIIRQKQMLHCSLQTSFGKSFK